MTRNKQNFAIGDWVKGKSKNGELIRGFVESTNPLEGWVRVNVVACDNEDTVGRTVVTLSTWVEKLPESSWDEVKILQLIDLSLLTYDEPWFVELSTKLNTLRQGRIGHSKKFKSSEKVWNR